MLSLCSTLSIVLNLKKKHLVKQQNLLSCNKYKHPFAHYPLPPPSTNPENGITSSANIPISFSEKANIMGSFRCP
jgi:hypothetical protein